MSDKTLRERLENTNNGAKPWPGSSVKKVDYFVEWEIERGKFQTETLRNSKLKSQVEQLQAEIERYSIREGKLLRDNARLQKAVIGLRDFATGCYKSRGCTVNGNKLSEDAKFILSETQEALASTDNSNWLQEQKAQWRREELSRDVLWQIDRKAFIKIMVDKFLCWKLPEHFRPDAGISFTPEYNVEYMAAQGKPPCRHEPVGTNLFSADQAEQMFEYCFPDTVEVNERRMAAEQYKGEMK